jgi:hypothetical protein
MKGWFAKGVTARVVPAGTEIEGDEDEGEEEFTVPEDQVALVFENAGSWTDHKGGVHQFHSDLFFLVGTPKEIWNALGRGMDALPEQ